ncbi:YkgJ family cysteine cluster protein [Thermodesulforhabdus norvegica]|uniref:YkgJ family cysteine cluster protein n=1 Tax=Thermodesulforhabdus norvegica TaxID=39841 RepID=A0A1I4V713_9BACT|nr:YkgJ family cysteine cluster protein [Thermodesulforhabdus norvegica]SFM96992.1 hypothetical protein SAMN05660836_02144 [Thermodesulforhabdus norvegica]
MVESKEELVLEGGDSICFACHQGLPCFTRCCRDVNIYLTPYDVLRMRRALGMGSSEFLSRYTRSFLAKVTHVPVVQLLMDPETLNCLLVTDEGCRIYDDRPWACRMYPLDINPRKPGSYRLIAGADKCFGLKEAQSWTLKEWLSSQGIEPYERMEALYQSIMPAGFKPGGIMDAGLGKLIFLAYDLDIFMEMVKDPKFRKLHEISEPEFNEAMSNDEKLLELAFGYIKGQLEELYGLA